MFLQWGLVDGRPKIEELDCEVIADKPTSNFLISHSCLVMLFDNNSKAVIRGIFPTRLLPSNAMSVKIYYSQRETKDAEHASRKYFSQLFVENSSFVDEAEALSSSPVVVIPVVDCGYFGKGTFRSCAFVLEVVSVKNS